MQVHTIFLIVHGIGERRVALQQSGRAPLVQVFPSYDAIGNRFGPIRSLATDCVLVMDDDILLDHRDIRLAYRSWRVSRTQLVGTFLRTLHKNGSAYVYRTARRDAHGLLHANVACASRASNRDESTRALQ